MRFRPDLAQLIRNGRKTEHRFPAAKHLKGIHPSVRRAVQPDGEKGICHIWITDVYRQAFEDIDHQDVLREGFHQFDGLLKWWEDTYRAEPDWGDEIQVIRFELYKDQDRVAKPPRDVVRSLRGPWDPGTPAGEGMAERRRAPEPEPVDPAKLHPAWSVKAEQQRVRAMMEREADFRDLPIVEQVKRAIADARAQGVDTSSPEYVIGKQVERLRRMSRKAA